MAVVVVAEFEGKDQGFYEQLSGKVMPDGQLPPGCQVHVAGPNENGWRVITVWESQEAFERTRDERLIPALGEVEGAAPPNIGLNPVYKLLTA
jgi:hypothetical protein